jgi:hypothetical protein
LPSIALVALVCGCAAAASKPTSPSACVTLTGIACTPLLKQLRAEIAVGTTREDAEATLKRYAIPYRYIPKPPPDPLVEPRPSQRSGRLNFGVDDGEWPKRGTRGYVVDVYLDKQDRVAAFHVNTVLAP